MPFFLTGESYVVKYIAMPGANILDANSMLPETLHVDLHGVAIVNGLAHTVAQEDTDIGLLLGPRQHAVEATTRGAAGGGAFLDA